MLGQFGDWGAYTATPGGRKVCFALSKPTSSVDNPPNRRTAANAVYMFISSRPDEKVTDEVSILVTGYAFKANTDASLTVGGGGFAMYTQNDGAWVKNAADEARLVDAMRKGADVVIKAQTSKRHRRPPTRSRSRASRRRSTASRRSASNGCNGGSGGWCRGSEVRPNSQLAPSELPNQSDTSTSTIPVSLSTRSSQRCLRGSHANFGSRTLASEATGSHLNRGAPTARHFRLC